MVPELGPFPKPAPRSSPPPRPSNVDDRASGSLNDGSDDEYDEFLESIEARGCERNIIENTDHVSSSNDDSKDCHPTDTLRFLRRAQENPTRLMLPGLQLIGSTGWALESARR